MILRGTLFRKYVVYFVTLVTVALVASGAIGVYFTYKESKTALLDLQREKALHPHRLRDLDRSVEGVLIRFHGGALFDNVLRPQAEQQSALLTMRTITFDAFVRHGKRDLGAQANP